MMVTSIKIKTILIILTFATLSIPAIAQNDFPAINDTTKTKHSFALTWNAAALPNNYPSFLFSAQYMWQEKISIEFGGSKLLNSEIFSSSGAHAEHKHGFKIMGEVKFYFDNNAHKNGPFVGLGYSHLESTFQADYIVKIVEEDQRYFRYVDEEYFSKIDQFYAKIGYRFLSKQERVFFETGINAGIKVKKLSPQPSDFGGRLVTNENFVNNSFLFPLPMSIDVKLGVILFR